VRYMSREKYEALVKKWGKEETERRIAEIKKQKHLQTNFAAIGMLYREIEWEKVGEVDIKGFWLGRWCNNFGQIDIYLLTEDGVIRIRDPIDRNPVLPELTPVIVTHIDRIQHTDTKEERLNAAEATQFQPTQIPPECLEQWAGDAGSIDEDKAYLVVDEIRFVNDIQDMELDEDGKWVLDDNGRPIVETVHPIIYGENGVNLKLVLGRGDSQCSMKIVDTDSLLALYNDWEVEDKEAFIKYLRDEEHERVMQGELAELRGKKIVVFGRGSRFITRKGEEPVELKTPFLSVSQMGFILTWEKACERIGGEPSTPPPLPSAPPIQEKSSSPLGSPSPSPTTPPSPTTTPPSSSPSSSSKLPSADASKMQKPKPEEVILELLGTDTYKQLVQTKPAECRAAILKLVEKGYEVRELVGALTNLAREGKVKRTGEIFVLV